MEEHGLYREWAHQGWASLGEAGVVNRLVFFWCYNRGPVIVVQLGGMWYLYLLFLG